MTFPRVVPCCIFLLLSGLFATAASAQVFRNYAAPAPPPEPGAPQRTAEVEKIYPLDSTFQRWEEASIHWLDADSMVQWEQQLPQHSFGMVAKNSNRLAVASVETIYTDGYASEYNLHLELFDLEGKAAGQLRLTNPKGITLSAVTADEEHFYLAYEKYTGSSARDMFIAQVDTQGNLRWETKLGQRYGTAGTRLLQVSPAGEVVLLGRMYNQVGFDILTREGVRKDRKMLYFSNEFSPVSFTFRKNGHLLAIGSQREYVNRATYSSSVVFELDQQYQVLQYCQVQTPFTDTALDIMEDEAQGHIYFLANAEDLKSPYGKRANFSVIGRLSPTFELAQTSSFQNTSTGLGLRLGWSSATGLWAYQRYFSRGPTFVLFNFKEDLSIATIWSKRGTYADPHQLLFAREGIYLGGGSRDSWLLKLRGM